MLGRWQKTALACMLPLVLSGCVHLDSLNIGRMLQSFSTGSAHRDAVSLRARTEQLLDQGQSIEALALLRQGADAGIERQQLSGLIVRATNLALTQAEQYSLEQQHLQSGILYRQTLNHYPADTTLHPQITRTGVEIETRIGECANRLLEDGLIAYRAGALEEAIDVWSQIRQFHPAYKASQQAIRTTRIQLKNLEAVTPAPTVNGS